MLDDPVDLYTAMQTLCRRNWILGQYILLDLKKLLKQAAADTNLVSKVFTAQLPEGFAAEVEGEFRCKCVISGMNARF